MTISQIRALGDRLRGKAAARVDDLALLQRLRSDYDAPLARAERIVREDLGLRATSRLKTVQTIIEKLVREKTRLSEMQDIAGLRIVDDLTLAQQDEIAARIAEAFPGSVINDRRWKPSFGYRAVHLIVEVDECLVEIQVRTRLQDPWAQTMEALADAWGRQIRYGLPPDGQAEPLTEADSRPTRSEVVETFVELSQAIALHEGTPAAGVDAKALRRVLERAVRAFRILSQ